MSKKIKIETKLDVYEAWFADRYRIMEYSFEVHDKLKKLLKSDTSDKGIVKEYIEETKKLFAGEPEPLSRRNTAYYMWGHVKNLVSRKEKKRIFGLLDHLDGDAENFSDIKEEFSILMKKYNLDDLLKTSYFDELNKK